MPRVARLLWYWLPVLLWMALILALSSRSDLRAAPPAPLAEVPRFSFTLSKLAHVVEYGVLGLLLLRALTGARGGVRLALWPGVVGAVLGSSLFGAVDEFRQSFVPNREPRFSDIALDTASALAATLLAASWLRRRGKAPPLAPLPTAVERGSLLATRDRLPLSRARERGAGGEG